MGQSHFARFARMMTLGVLAVAMAACGAAADDSAAEETGQTASALSSTLNGPFIGGCTTTLTLDKVVNASGATVMRAVCSVTCKDKGTLMFTDVGLAQRSPADANNGASAGPLNVLGTQASLTAEAPYSPGTYQADCSVGWKSDNKGPSYVSPFIPATQF